MMRGVNNKIMSDSKHQNPIPKKEEDDETRKNADDNDDPEDDASKQEDVNIQLSNTTIRTVQTNTNSIEPVIRRDTSIVATSGSNNNNSNSSTAADFHLMTQEEEDLTMKVRSAGDALYDLVMSAIERAKTISAQKVKELATKDISPAAIAAKKDAKDIASLGEPVESLARTFESLMTEIRKQPYSEQVNLLTGYKKLLKEQINVIESRISMTKRLK
jgi:hypothetical protein